MRLDAPDGTVWPERQGAPPRLNLPAIAAALARFQGEFEAVNRTLQPPREPLLPEVAGNLLSGYALVDELLAADVDIFAFGHLHSLLDLNARVLCGTRPGDRAEFRKHIEATSHHFYETTPGGVRDLVESQLTHAGASAWRRAALAYIRILSEPQLFIEGNHRTGALVISYILARSGQPPFVLTSTTAQDYFGPSLAIKRLRKNGFASWLRMRSMTENFAEFLEARSDPRFLLR